jgi:predicted transcriptional regulator
MCYSACVSALVIALTVHVKESETGRLLYFERRKIVGARLAGACVTKSATLLGVSKAKVSKVMSAYTNHGKTTSEKRNNGRKSTVTQRDHRTLVRIVSKNHSTPSQVTEELNIHLKDPFPQKLSDMSFTNPTSIVGLQLLNL